MQDDHPHFRLRLACEVCSRPEKTILLSKAFLDPVVYGFLTEYYAGRIDPEVLSGADYEIARCNGCGFMWQTAILRDRDLGRLYSEWIVSGESREKRLGSDHGLYSGYAREMGHIAAFARKRPREIAVLDHGMGWGYWCRMATAFGFRAYGTELSEERQEYARTFGAEIVSIDALPGAHFDFVNSEQSFEHIPNPGQSMKKLAAALKAGGVMRVAVPDAGWGVKRLGSPAWRARKDAFHPLEHINCFTHGALRRLGREAGLSPVMRPMFPVVATGPGGLVRSFVAPLFYRFAGTIQYFRKGSG
jgi:SAM-dependent methyltransferase